MEFTSKAQRRKAAADRRKTGRPLMVSEEDWERARQWAPSPLDLLGWWTTQRAELKRQDAALVASWEESLEALSDETTAAEWARHWLRQARLTVQQERINRLEAVAHILVCPNHGVDGVEEWDQSLNRAASLRGQVVKDGTSWESYCLRCLDGSQVKTLARKLTAQWEETSI